MGFLNTYLVLFLVMELTITDMALAQLPGAPGQQIQPALTLALALTSLVLLLFYIYLRKDRFNRSSESPKKEKKADAHPDGIPRIPLETRRLATDEALCHLFDCHTIPMAKSTLEPGRVIDANPSFCKLLGYPKKDLVGKTWVELGIIPVKENSNQQLVEHGWIKSIAPINKSGQVLNLSILSLLVPPEPDHQSDQSMEKENWQVLTIVSEPMEGVCQSIAPQSYHKVSQ